MAYLSGTGILNLAPVLEDGEHLLRGIVELHNALIELLFSGVADCTNWIRISVCVCVCVCVCVTEIIPTLMGETVGDMNDGVYCAAI